MSGTPQVRLAPSVRREIAPLRAAGHTATAARIWPDGRDSSGCIWATTHCPL